MTGASLVINTGDITNSVNENNEGSKLVNNDDFVELLQFDEWKMFEPILHDNIQVLLCTEREWSIYTRSLAGCTRKS